MIDPLNPNIIHVRHDARPLAELATAIVAEDRQVRTTAQASLEHARRAGELLLQAQSQMPHGSWLAWVEQHCQGLTTRTAQRYMRLASRWGELEGKCDTVSHLTLRRSLELLSEADELAELQPEARHLLDTGAISAEAARHLLRLRVFDRAATRACEDGQHKTWADHESKRILWNPGRHRTEADIARAVDFSLTELLFTITEYAHLDADAADAKASAALAGHQDAVRDGVVDSDCWAGIMWTQMRPSADRLDDEDLESLKAALEATAAA